VLAAPNALEAETKLKLWARFSDSDGGILENVIVYPPGQIGERTLVLIKPDNFKFPTGRPGNVIDFFSRTGLYVVGVKVLHMSLAQALDFYGPVREVLRTKLKGGVGERAARLLEKEFGFKIPPDQQHALGEILGPVQGDHQFDNIMRFMTGHTPSEFKTDAECQQPGTQKCIALVYEGVNAVRKIRDVLGPTDPSTARTRAIRWKTPNAKWPSSNPAKIIFVRSSRNFTGSCKRAISPAAARQRLEIHNRPVPFWPPT
jgi:nucleoside diphosphate kinase